MRHNSTIIPNGRDDTWDTTEVHRKTPEEMFSTAFNLEQQKALLAMFSQGGSGGDCECDKGYECTEDYTLLTDESVTTVAGDFGNQGNLAYSTPITADTIKVTFNGVEYTCPKIGAVPAYGAPYNEITETFDWSEYPFNIPSLFGSNLLKTETAGTYQVKIEALEESVETSECFEKAVKKVGGGAFQVKAVSKDAETGVVTYNCSTLQLQAAFNRGDYITFYDDVSGFTPLVLRDCIVSWDNDHPRLVGMLNYVTMQTSPSNSQVTSLIILFNTPSSEDEMLTSGGDSPK